jgi:RHS repeat-associated protein
MIKALKSVLPVLALLIGITLTGVAGAVTLSASPASVVQGGSVTATWSGIVAPTVDNWIGTFKPGSSNSEYVTRQWTGGGASGSAAVSIPIGLATGTYELRLFVRDSFTLLATSNTFSVTSAPPALTVTPASVNAGANVTASWVRMPAPSTGDWIALAIPGSPNTEFISFRNAGGTAAGSMYFPIPAEIYTGTYELRYFASGTNTLRATSNAFAVTGITPTSLTASPGSLAPGASLTVNWAAIATPRAGDWIAFAPTGSPNDVWQARFDTNGAASGGTSFTIPAGTGNGTFELRLYASGTTTRLATSNTITVAGMGPTISASPSTVVPGGAVTATWSGIYTPKVSDWVGLYVTGAPDIPNLAQVFTQGTAPSGTGSIPITAAIAPGTYELRLFDSAGSRLATSGSFTVGTAISTTIFYIQPDHLDTPRVIANQAQQTVWRWDNDDPFGANIANSDPSGLGTFVFNLRLPGQYFDVETNNHYNYFRDYSPGIGRYIQSDPMGLRGGINTYTYVSNRSLLFSDIFGLQSQNIRQVQRDPYSSSYSRQERAPEVGGMSQSRSRSRLAELLSEAVSPASAEAISFLPPEVSFRICLLYRCKNPPGVCPEFEDVRPPIAIAPGSDTCVCIKYETGAYQPTYQTPTSIVFWPP